MLNKLLDLLREGGTHRISDLAEELGTTPELVEVMLEDLARKGYLKHTASQCSEKCATCPVSGLCAAGGSSQGGGSSRIWVLAEDKAKL